MPEHGNATKQKTARPRPNYGVDDRGAPIWRDEDEEIVSGRNWSVILIFLFVPLMALIVLVFCLHALFVHAFGTSPAPQTVIERTTQPN